MSQFIKQAVFLLASFAAVFFWQLSPLAEFTVPALGFLVFLYLILSKQKSSLPKRYQQSEISQEQSIKDSIKTLNKDGVNIFILNTIVFLLIFSTGSLNSPLFFLLYFISFAIAFVLLPQMVFVFILGSILIFLPDALILNETSPETKLLVENLIKLASLGLISPLAYFFGKEYQERIIHQEQDKEVAEIISNEAANVLNNEEDRLSEEDKEQLVDIIEESEKLKE